MYLPYQTEPVKFNDIHDYPGPQISDAVYQKLLSSGGIDHEEMTRRLLFVDEVREVFARHGDGLAPEDVAALLAQGTEAPRESRTGRLLFQILSGELDVPWSEAGVEQAAQKATELIREAGRRTGSLSRTRPRR